MKTYTCPICGYPYLTEPPDSEDGYPASFEICPSCGVEFGYEDGGRVGDDLRKRRNDLREEWISKGCIWHSAVPRPTDWDPIEQLKKAGFHEILQKKDITDTEKMLDKAYNKAIKLITDEKGNWQDKLDWSNRKHRSIIITIINKASVLWKHRERDSALELFRKLFKTIPDDDRYICVRYFILAIRMDMGPEEFEKKILKEGYSALEEWFDKNYKKFPDEFDWYSNIQK